MVVGATTSQQMGPAPTSDCRVPANQIEELYPHVAYPCGPTRGPNADSTHQ